MEESSRTASLPDRTADVTVLLSMWSQLTTEDHAGSPSVKYPSHHFENHCTLNLCAC